MEQSLKLSTLKESLEAFPDDNLKAFIEYELDSSCDESYEYDEEKKVPGLAVGKFFVVMGTDFAVRMFKIMDDDNIERATLAITDVRCFGVTEAEELLQEYYNKLLSFTNPYSGGLSYGKKVLEIALGQDKAMDVIGKLVSKLTVKPFAWISNIPSTQIENLYFCLKEYRPQIIATFLACLRKELTAEVLMFFSEEEKNDLLERVSKMKSLPQKEILEELERELESKMATLLIKYDDYQFDGSKLVEQIQDLLAENKPKSKMKELD